MLHDFQYGFQEKHSTLHALLDVNVYALDAIQNKRQTALLLIDVRKAFDSVSPNILLLKLYQFVALHISFLKVIFHFETNLYPCKTTTPL